MQEINIDQIGIIGVISVHIKLPALHSLVSRSIISEEFVAPKSFMIPPAAIRYLLPVNGCLTSPQAARYRSVSIRGYDVSSQEEEPTKTLVIGC